MPNLITDKQKRNKFREGKIPQFIQSLWYFYHLLKTKLRALLPGVG